MQLYYPLLALFATLTTVINAVSWPQTRDIFRAWPEPIILLDMNWNIQAASSIYIRHISPAVAEDVLMGTSFLDLCSTRVARLYEIKEALEHVRHHGQSHVCHVEGISSMSYHIEIHPLRKPDDRGLFGVRVSILSATKISLMQANIFGSKQKMDDAEIWTSLIDSLVAHSVFLTDTDKRIITWGRGAQRMFGFSTDEAEGMRFPQLVQGNEPLPPLKSDANGQRYEMHMTQKDGQQVVTETKMFPVHSQQGVPLGFGHIVRDLTEQRRIESAIVDAGRTSVQVQASIIGKVSHEYGNSLAIIMNAAELIQTPSHEQDNTRYRQLGSEITQAARLLKHIFSGMLDCTQFMEKGVSIQLETIEISTMLAEVAEHYPCPVQLGFSSEVDPQLPGSLKCDQNRLVQIMGHLLSNSYKFTLPGGSVAQSFYLDQTEDIPMWVMAVEDTGVGVAPDSLPHLGQPFYQGANTKYYEGIGTGLYLTRIITETMGGKMVVTSTRHKGTRVEIRLPLVVPEPETPEGQDSPTLTSDQTAKSRKSSVLSLDTQSVGSARTMLPEWANHCRVLLVEDNPILQRLTRRILLGLQVATCDVVARGDTAVEMALQEPRYHIIFMDLDLEGDMHGIEATRRIKQHDHQVCIITLSSQNSPLDRSLCAEAGMQDYIVKPVSRVELYRSIVSNLSKQLSPISTHTRRSSLERDLAAYTLH